MIVLFPINRVSRFACVPSGGVDIPECFRLSAPCSGERFGILHAYFKPNGKKIHLVRFQEVVIELGVEFDRSRRIRQVQFGKFIVGDNLVDELFLFGGDVSAFR